MPIFAQDSLREKLILLYCVRQTGIGMTGEQLLKTVTDTGVMTYYAYRNAVSELTEDGYLTHEVREFGQVYMITDTGLEILEMFLPSLPESTRCLLEDRILAGLDAFRRERRIRSSMEDAGNGSCSLTLEVLDGETRPLTVKLEEIPREMAQRIRDNWQEAAERVYALLFSTLLYPNGNGNHTETKEERT